MKGLILAVLLMFVITPVYAYNFEIFDETELGAKVDLPDLIKKDNHSIGVEVGFTDLHQDWEDSGYAVVKYTWRGSILDFSKK